MRDSDGSSGKERGRVLVVDDSDINQDVARKMLQIGDCEVSCVGSGEAALDAVRAEPFDVVLMDIQMPGLDGIETTRLIRGLDGERARVPVVAMTANVTAEMREACRAAGFDDFVAKPINRGELLHTIGAWVERRRTGSAGHAGEANARVPGARAIDGTAGLDTMSLEQMRTDLGDSFATLVEKFFADADSRLERIGAALSVGEFDTARRDAHTLKSTSASFGATALAAQAKAMEDACAASDAAAADAHREPLAHAVAAAQDAIRAYLGRGDRG